MAHEKNHDYHILPPSLVAAAWRPVAAFVMLFGAVLWMAKDNGTLHLPDRSGRCALRQLWRWWAEVRWPKAIEAGDHTPVVRIGLRYGFIFFIMSEVMFFAAWFWSFFKHALYPMGP